MRLVIDHKHSKLRLMKRLLPLLLLIATSAAMAESGAYRVEVVVFQHLQAEAEAVLVEELRSYSQFPELRPEPQPVDKTVMPTDGQPAAYRADLPDDLRVLTDKSTRMKDVWRRLTSSAYYQTLAYASWEQNRTDYYPPMRVHDENIIATEAIRTPTIGFLEVLSGNNPGVGRRNFYGLDGSVQLRRSRFLHLFLDLEYRADTAQNAQLPSALDFSDIPSRMESDVDFSRAHRVFKLKQNRQIRTGRMQYFDTPYFGALVFVSAVQPK